MAQKNKTLNKEIDLGRIKDVDILTFTKQLATTIKSGLTISEGLDILQDQSRPKMRRIIEEISTDVETGMPFHQALRKHSDHFSQVYINMVRSGELSGTLEENLFRLTVSLQKSYQLKKKIKSAMIYPILIFVAIFGLGMSVGIFVLPKLLPLFNTLNIELPFTTKVLLFLAEAFQNHGALIFFGTTGLIVFLIWFFRRQFIKPFTHNLILKLPIVKKIIKNVNLEKFNRSMGTMLESGLTLNQTLRIVAMGTNNVVYRKAIEDFIPQVEAGEHLKIIAQKYPKLFPAITTKMIGIGEKTGNLENIFQYLGDFYEEEVDDAVKNISTIIEPAMLIIIGVLMGVVALSILGPIYQVTGGINV